MAVYWVIGFWVVSTTACVIFERFVPGASIWDARKPREAVSKYCLLVLLSPFVVILAATVGVIEYFRNSWCWLIGKPVWLGDFQGGILTHLIKRRQKYDASLKNEKIIQWPEWRLWDQPEAIIYDITKKYLTLISDGVNQPVIWHKLEAFRAEFGIGGTPSSPTITEYIRYRLDIEAPQYAAFGEDLLQQQVKDCITDFRYKLDSPNVDSGFPRSELLGGMLSLNEIEKLGVAESSVLSRFQRDMSNLKFRMLDGDEVWTFGGSLTQGVALMRDGKVIEYVVTLWMCGGCVSNTERVPMPVPLPYEKTSDPAA